MKPIVISFKLRDTLQIVFDRLIRSNHEKKNAEKRSVSYIHAIVFYVNRQLKIQLTSQIVVLLNATVSSCGLELIHKYTLYLFLHIKNC